MNRLIILALLCASFLALLFFPQQMRYLLAAASVIFLFGFGSLLFFGLLMLHGIIDIPQRNYEPRMSWWQALKETCNGMFNGTLLDDFHQLPR